MNTMTTLSIVNIQLDDQVLENLMIQEETKSFTGTLSEVRVTRNTDTGMGFATEIQEATGTLYSRVFSLLESTWGCVLQTDFRANVQSNPAFALIQSELREAADNGELDAKFDLIETTGAIVTYDKVSNMVTLGLNETQMRCRIREFTQMVDLRNKRLIDHANGVTPDSIFREPKDKVLDTPQIGTSFYVSFPL